nr:hemagglutinin [Bifidobacterium callitrichidarum]
MSRKKAAKTSPSRNRRRTSGTRRRKAGPLKRAWRRANWFGKLKMVLIPTVAIIVIVALIIAAVRFVRWRGAVIAAEKAQLELAQTYDFNPGDIISDGQFFNGSAMSAAEVQSFLDQQGGSLASMTFDTTNESGDGLCEDYAGGKGQSAATIIAAAGAACGVSQKVLLTVLQKEQHLVTAVNPSAFQLRSAMGLSCPDTADCDPAYDGFAKQMYGAAKRYRYYLEHEEQYGYRAGDLNYIQYHPNKACGGTQVYIENKATALLYIYTPYQPNVAALAAGTGSGDACSSYGNRNFSLIYTGWFGSART